METTREEMTDAEKVSAALDAHKGEDNLYRFPAGLYSFVLQTGKRYSGEDPEHDQILEFFDGIAPVVVDREMVNDWIEETAKAVGVNAIEGNWANVKNAGRRILPLENLRVSMNYLIPQILAVPHYAVYKKEPRDGGYKYTIEIRIGSPYEGATIIDKQKTETFLNLIRYQYLRTNTVWANPAVFTPVDGGNDKIIFRANVVFSLPDDCSKSSKDAFSITRSDDGNALVLSTTNRPSRFANNPGGKRK